MDMNATKERLHEPHAPAVQHERSDVSVRQILLFGVLLMVSAGVIHLLVWRLFDYFSTQAARAGRPRSAIVRDTGKPTPPEPRLQVAPRQDLQAMRDAEDAVLNGYGWTDQHAGSIRIPVERAMEILARRGLPVESGEGGQGKGDTPTK